AVAWINGRSEMLALGFGALAVWAAATRRALVLGSTLLLALLGKETALVFAPVALAVALVLRPAARDPRRFVWQPLVAVVVAVAAYATLRGYALGHTAVPPHAGVVATPAPVSSRAAVTALLPWRAAPIQLA